jgi:nucleotide-binding universal stress UspA family protein
MNRNEIVVGVDGSTQSRAALRFAAAEADRHDTALRIVAAYELDVRAARFGGADRLEQIVRERYEEIVADALTEAGNMVPEVTATGTAIAGLPGAVLLDAARGARLLVVGNRGHGGFGSLLLGSVSQYVALHAQIPVVVVRGNAEPAGRPVIVGVDGPERADAVLAVAFAEAAARGTGVVAVHAYSVPVPAWTVAYGPIPFSDDAIRKVAVEDLDATLAPWREKYPNVSVEALVGRGSAARMLVDVSHNGALVVVGSRGHNATVGALLGSVATQLLHHSDSPVLIAH